MQRMQRMPLTRLLRAGARAHYASSESAPGGSTKRRMRVCSGRKQAYAHA